MEAKDKPVDITYKIKKGRKATDTALQHILENDHSQITDKQLKKAFGGKSFFFKKKEYF